MGFGVSVGVSVGLSVGFSVDLSGRPRRVPRLTGRRIGVHHVFGDARSLRGRQGDHQTERDQPRVGWGAVAYAEAYPVVMADVRREREGSLKHVREQVEYPDGVEPPNEKRWPLSRRVR